MKEIIYIGTYDDKIYIVAFENGKLEIINKSEKILNPSYLNINKDILYSVSETQLGVLQAFKIEKDRLKTINSKIINQKLPCHITTNINRTKLLVSNYGSGSVLLLDLNKDGSINEVVKEVQFNGAHMHFSEFIDRKIYSVDLGNDLIYIFDENLNLLSEIYTKEDVGPRHLIVLKEQKKLFVVTELSNEILIYEEQNNKYNLVQQLSTLEKQTGNSYAGAIKVSSNGKNIYVSNRGHNSISVFKKNGKKYELIQNISCFGDFPRDIAFNKTEDYLIVANQKSDNIIIYKRNKENGILTKVKNEELTVKRPACIIRQDYEA